MSVAKERNNRREQIVDAARAEFARHGYHGASIDLIIARAGIARATFYAYFKSKREVFDAALDELIEVVYRSLPPIVPQQPVVPQALKNLERIIEALIDDVDLARIILMEGHGPDTEVREKVGRFQERLVRYAEDTLRLGQTLSLVRDGDVRVMAACLIGAIKEALHQHVVGIRSRDEMDAFPAEMLRTFLSGVGTEQVQAEKMG